MGALKGKKLETLTCPICHIFSSKRLTNFEDHLALEHHTTARILWNSLNNGPILCGCGCGNEAPFHGWKHGYGKFIIGHNANVYSSYAPERAAELIKQRSESLAGKTGWAKGLTKESDDRIAKRAKATSEGRRRAFIDGDIVAWNKGLTKDNDPRVAAAAVAQQQRFEAKDVRPWAEGKTEAGDECILRKNNALRKRYAKGELEPWYKGKTIASEPRLEKLWQHRDPVKEYAGIRWTDDEIRRKLAGNMQLILQDIDGYRNDRIPALVVMCRTCSETSKVSLVFARNDRCHRCNPTSSAGQNQIADWLESLGLKVGRNVKGIIGNRQELDVYVPSHKLAIEFNGLYWHNEAGVKGPKYHQNKSNRCAELGITLQHVFEDEWYERPDIVKSMIMHRLSMTPKRTSARKCNLREATIDERRTFFEANHIDGDVPSTKAWCLVDEEGIVACISIRKPFHKSQSKLIEIARFSTKTYTSCAGALSRLMRCVVAYTLEHKLAGVMTYVDTRFGNRGKGYCSAGMTFIKETEPRFWWTDSHHRFNRFKFRADRGRQMSEAQVAEAADVVKIWGCKNLVYQINV